MSYDDDEERIAAAKAEAERIRQEMIENALAEKGHIRIDNFDPRFRKPKPWEQGYNQRTHD